MPTIRAMRKIVLTGGPGAGKTVITSALAVADPQRFVRVPEAATAVYDHLQTRWDRLDLAGRRDVQRQIFRHQLEQEDRLIAAHPDRTVLLDRGTIDGAAYWPDGAEAYWQDLRTSLAGQLARYDAVIWMQTGAALGHYDGDASNAVRFEDMTGAIESGLRLRELWGGHPRVIEISAFPTIGEKIAAVKSALEKLISGSLEADARSARG